MRAEIWNPAMKVEDLEKRIVLDVFDRVDVPTLGIEGGIVIGRAVRNTCTVQDKDGMDHRVQTHRCYHTDPVKNGEEDD